ncbi:hypothetical protein LOC68_00990 [Blastopirellula sp. JC732]|uniref:Uncharacterized protein n=1 Tax=Blastopirellula sediminis TaxID=2894196 RepID=A0A9X1MIU5_9BACT|nr:hypothetical protein [Blastopirellula sediminis]MCC9608237.1 hypothetical protein [Blastopirellula sediminis]MCC9626970.1 hypothetical protein [Blastopirellula sediminis]
MSNGSESFDEYPYFFLPRPVGQLNSLPVELRWEVTRRHPFYISFWSAARDHFARVPNQSLQVQAVRQIAAGIVNAVGVTASVPDPRLSFEELDEATNRSSWLNRAITPVSCRGLLGRLLAILPPAEFLDVMSRITNAMQAESDEISQRYAGLLEMQSIEGTLDFGGPEPLVSINPRLANGIIQRDLDNLLEEWRDRLEITVGRDRSDSIPDFLQVWDSREGWREGAYHSEEEHTLKEVAQLLDISESNANSRYRRAFELITGYEYSPTMWVRFMGIVKISQVSLKRLGRVARSRPLKERGPREVPESTLASSGDSRGVINGLSEQVVQDNIEIRDLMIDISEWAEAGLTDAEIHDKLKISEDISDVIQFIRTRGN